MTDQPASQASPIPEAERAKERLAARFGTPPPERTPRPLTDEDKAAVERVSQSPTHSGTGTDETEGQISSATADLQELTSDLRESDPDAAEVAAKEAQKLEELS